MATTHPTTRAPQPVLVCEPTSAAEVLAAAASLKQVEQQAAAQLLTAALAWADLHPAESIDHAAQLPETEFMRRYAQEFGEQAVSVAGPGAPLVAEFAVAEFAATLGVKTEWGASYLGEALELRHRLPRTWARVLAGQVPAGRARRIARATIAAQLTVEAAAWVDTHVAHCAEALGPVQLDRAVEAAIARFMPEVLADRAAHAADGRRFDIDTRPTTTPDPGATGAGTARVEGTLDLADALDLDAAVTARAAQLKASGSGESLDVRRAMAVGDLARADLPLDYDRTADTDDADDSAPRPAAGRQVVVYVHLSADAVTGSGGLARVENGGGHLGHLITADQVRAWCGTAAQIVIKPVVDLAGVTQVMAYEVPDQIREQVILRDLTCVFPHCTRPARGCDVDHIDPWRPPDHPDGPGGPTAPHNLAPLCRRHHRLKTHGAWRYRMIRPGAIVWTSPHGMVLLRDHRGTTNLTPDRPPT